MNKKIASEFWIGVIMLIAIILGGIFWKQGKKINKLATLEQQQIQSNIKEANTEFSGWNLFDRREMGYALKFPSDWKSKSGSIVPVDAATYDGCKKIEPKFMEFDCRIETGTERIDDLSEQQLSLKEYLKKNYLYDISTGKKSSALAKEIDKFEVENKNGFEILKTHNYEFTYFYITGSLDANGVLHENDQVILKKGNHITFITDKIQNETTKKILSTLELFD